MRATLLSGPRDIRIVEVDEPRLVEPGDAIVRLTATCVCGSDLWNYRGIRAIGRLQRPGHELVGVVTAIGADVTAVAVGDFVVGPFSSSCGECAHCRAGFQSACRTVQMFTDGSQAEAMRVPQADGTLVALAEHPDPALVPSLLACSDVMATGWHAALMAGVRPGSSVAIVGDGAVGLCGVIAARQLGADRIIISSRHEQRQQLAADFGATDIVAERGDAFAAEVLDLTDGIGADAALECVGSREALLQAGASARAGAIVGFVGVPVGVDIPLEPFFRRNVGLRGGMAPVRNYLPELIDLVLAGTIDPGKVFDVTLPLDEVAEAYAAMDERRAIKVLLQP